MFLAWVWLRRCLDLTILRTCCECITLARPLFYAEPTWSGMRNMPLGILLRCLLVATLYIRSPPLKDTRLGAMLSRRHVYGALATLLLARILLRTNSVLRRRYRVPTVIRNLGWNWRLLFLFRTGLTTNVVTLRGRVLNVVDVLVSAVVLMVLTLWLLV